MVELAVISVATKLLHQPAFDKFVLLIGKDVHRMDLEETYMKIEEVSR